MAGLEVLPELVKTGVSSLKIEGRLKTAEYVANVTRVYRQALDRAIATLTPEVPADTTLPKTDETKPKQYQVTNEEHYNLEMAFSRGISTGWFKGINNQELVHARFGKKRGVYLGEVTRIRNEQITVQLQAPVKPGDGVVFDCGHPETKEEGGRIYAVEYRGEDAILSFGRGNLNLRGIHVGDKIWKTSDPELDKQLRQSFSGENPQFQRGIDIEVYGEVGQGLSAVAHDELGHFVQVQSEMPLVEAHSKPITTERLRSQFSRLGNTPFYLNSFTNHISGNVSLQCKFC